MNGEAVLFEERQNPPTWVRALLLSIPLLPVYGFYQQVIAGRPFGNRPMSDAGLAVMAGATGALAAVLWRMRLEIRVRPGELEVRFWPFSRRRIPCSEIVAHNAVTYRPIRDFGGWGIRWSWSGERAYSMQGNRGVRLDLADGTRLLIGTQQPEALAAALTTAGAVKR